MLKALNHIVSATAMTQKFKNAMANLSALLCEKSLIRGFLKPLVRLRSDKFNVNDFLILIVGKCIENE